MELQYRNNVNVTATKYQVTDSENVKRNNNNNNIGDKNISYSRIPISKFNFETANSKQRLC